MKNRRYCFGCVPFKSSDRYSNRTSAGRQYSRWTEEQKAAHRLNVTKKGKERKRLLLERAGGKCLMCGYPGPSMRALTFHHRVPEEKLFDLNIDSIKSKNWDAVLAEADKCDLLCIRCHLEVEEGVASAPIGGQDML